MEYWSLCIQFRNKKLPNSKVSWGGGWGVQFEGPVKLGHSWTVLFLLWRIVEHFCCALWDKLLNVGFEYLDHFYFE